MPVPIVRRGAAMLCGGLLASVLLSGCSGSDDPETAPAPGRTGPPPTASSVLPSADPTSDPTGDPTTNPSRPPGEAGTLSRTHYEQLSLGSTTLEQFYALVGRSTCRTSGESGPEGVTALGVTCRGSASEEATAVLLFHDGVLVSKGESGLR